LMSSAIIEMASRLILVLHDPGAGSGAGDRISRSGR